MELKHTPGPWFTEDDDWTKGGDALITCESREGMISVAKVEGGGSESGYDSEFARQQSANAKLIAAAPELMEALQELVFLYEHDEGCRELTEYKRAKAAIAKATGH